MNNKNNKGITLLEILISLLIFGIAAAGILRSFTFCNMRAKSTSLRVAAMALAQEKIEQIKNDNYTNVTTGVYPSSPETLSLDTAGTADTNDDLTCTRTVNIIGFSPNPKTITITVTWNFKGNQFSESLTTIKIP